MKESLFPPKKSVLTRATGVTSQKTPFFNVDFYTTCSCKVPKQQGIAVALNHFIYEAPRVRLS
jgi:hypothetical protein